MPAFQKLLQGGLEAITRAQQELHPSEDALTLLTQLRLDAKRSPRELIGGAAAAKAKEIYEGQHLGGLELYHGSPHLFRPTPVNPLGEFDFLSNLSQGEGYQAFGPGGYLTGNEPLGWEYARNTTARKNNPRGRDRGPPPIPDTWLAAYRHDPEGFIEFLRARTVQKGRGYGVFDPGRWVQKEASSQAGHSGAGFVSEVKAKNIDPYLDAMKRTAWVDDRLTNFNRSDWAADSGRKLLDAGALSEGAPSLSVKKLPGSEIPAGLGWGQQRTDFLRDMQERMGLDPARFTHLSLLNPVRNNLNATESGAFYARNPNVSAGLAPGRPTKYKQSMSDTLDLRRLGEGPIPEEPKPEYRPRLYTAKTPATPTEMFSYDFPLEINAPRVVAALHNIAIEKKLPLPTEYGFETVTGERFIKQLREKLGSKEAVKTLRDADVPGMYFQRAGRRDNSVPPSTFDPDSHNFVWFDDPMLNIVKREDKKDGGSVVRQ